MQELPSLPLSAARIAAPIRPLVDWLGRGYAVALLAVVPAMYARRLLEPLIGPSAPLLPFVGAVVIAAWAGGWWPGLLATALSALALTWDVFEPKHSFEIEHHTDILILGLFVALSFGVSALCEALHRYRRQSLQRAAALERALDAREQAEQQLRVAIEAAGMGTWRYEFATGAVQYSPQVGPMFGQPRGYVHESIEAWRRDVHPDDLRRIDEQRRIRPGVDHYRYEYRVRHPDGTERLLQTRGRVIHGDDGRPMVASGIVQDVTEAKRREERLIALTQAVPQIVWIATVDGRVEFFNQQWYEFSGLSPAQSLDRHWHAAMHPDDRARVADTWRDAARGRTRVESEFRLKCADGTFRWFLSRAMPSLDENGRVQRWYGTCTDIDRAKVTEQVLRDQEAELMEADRRKDVFLATLAHELRNPLAPMRYALKLLGPEVPADVAANARAVIDRQLAHTARLVDDLLDVSRITRGVLELKKERLDVRQVIGTATETARPVIEEHAHALAIELPEQPLHVDADAVRLTQVIGNLLNNAAKYTERGGRIAIRARALDSSCEIEVTDSGIGIDPEMLPRVFDMFAQVDRRSTLAQGGLGIGLSLARHLVRLHGGAIEASSAGLARGSTFRITLPLATRAQAPVAPAPAGNVVPLFRTRRRVVVADDNRDAALSLAKVLEIAGWQVHVAHDGTSSIELAAALRPDVLVLDIGMPLMDGLEVAQWIRAQPWGRAVLLIAITGWGQVDDRRRTAEAGFDAHLTKPVDPDELLRRIDALAAGQTRTQSG